MANAATRWGTEIAVKAGEFVLGGLAGYLFSARYPDAPPGLEWVIGAVVFLATLMLEQTFRAGWQAERQDEVISTLSLTLASEGTERALLQAALGYGGHDLTPSQTNKAWQTLSMLTQKSYVATNYIDPKAFYTSGMAEDVVQLQKAKIRVHEDFAVKKVLIWKDAAERDSPLAEDVRRLHLDDPRAPMELKGILKERIDANSSLCGDLKTHLGGQLDFAVFDKLVVLAWHLDGERKIASGMVIVGKQPVGRFCDFFEALSCEATPVAPYAPQSVYAASARHLGAAPTG